MSIDAPRRTDWNENESRRRFVRAFLHARENPWTFADTCRQSNRGYLKAFLWTTHELTTAARLYGSAGFRLTEEKESTAFGKLVRERRYRLLLQKT